MRVATLILALIFMIPLTVQSCAIMGLGGIAGQSQTAGAGLIGIVMALLWIVGAAFALGKPTVSVVMFALAGLFGWMLGATSRFSDLNIWAIASVILAVLSFFGRRELRAKGREKTT